MITFLIVSEKISPTIFFFKSPYNSGSDRPCCNKYFNPTLNLETNSCAVDKILKKFSEVYDTDSPDEEVYLLKFYFLHFCRSHD